jgi:hypothetical protein
MLSIEIIVLVDANGILSILAAEQPFAEPMEQSDNIILFINLFILHLISIKIEYDKLSLIGRQFIDSSQFLRKEVNTQVIE